MFSKASKNNKGKTFSSFNSVPKKARITAGFFLTPEA
jgi:hypothetical protein